MSLEYFGTDESTFKAASRESKPIEGNGESEIETHLKRQGITLEDFKDYAAQQIKGSFTYHSYRVEWFIHNMATQYLVYLFHSDNAAVVVGAKISDIDRWKGNGGDKK